MSVNQGLAAVTRPALVAIAPLLFAAQCDGPKVTISGNASAIRNLAQPSVEWFYVQNTSEADVVLGDVSSAGLGLSAPFSLAGGSCVSGATLPKSGGCALEVTFEPFIAGSFSERINLNYTWTGNTGKSATASFQFTRSSNPPLYVRNDSAAYQVTSVGASVRAVIDLNNDSGTEQNGYVATLGSISDVAVGPGSPFTISGGTCKAGTALPYLSGCSLEVEFAPTRVGSFSDMLEVRYSYPRNMDFTLSIPVRGVAAAVTPMDCFQTGCGSGQVCLQVTSSGTGAGTCVEIPPPPPNCMAPCLWNARRSCLPVMGACNSSTTTDASGQLVTLSCDPKTRWARQVNTDSHDMPRRFTEERKNGNACFAELEQGFLGEGLTHWFGDGTAGIAIARDDVGAIYGYPRHVWCGSYTQQQASDYSFKPSEPAFIENDSTECKDWNATFLTLTECRISQSGTCAGL